MKRPIARSPDGLLMVSPIVPFIAEVFMNKLESEMFPTQKIRFFNM
jgi:hypothetical protein